MLRFFIQPQMPSQEEITEKQWWQISTGNTGKNKPSYIQFSLDPFSMSLRVQSHKGT